MNCLSDGGLIMPEQVLTGRKIAKDRRNHFTGQFTSGPDEGETSGIESHTELCGAHVIIARPGVVGLENQVPCEWQQSNGRKGTHYFDFRVLMADGCRRGAARETGDRGGSMVFSTCFSALPAESSQFQTEA
ncbi:hypothetical protein SAMN05421666_3260 [Roseovarius nanhaiticus]|uniref:Uncharacterized protein n=1 Tax=Roseovarius nanhaiticus TaxID=573024 RepID=A0A1N7HKP2_9RHOB|nr:hypothetical protein [Roseovarius nanhaiticus]SEL25826.1 hypothetical protein SAMN05216208_3236 [Roseovarius nanhaiticus]SIS25373.1 hypothetical protein SAMN05421666_3260 [Roseovarius nanhaiticus]